MILIKWIIPIVAIVVCGGIIIYSLRHHTWTKPEVIAVIVAIVVALSGLLQSFGSNYSTEKSFQEMKADHGMILNKGDEIYLELTKLNEKIDINDPIEIKTKKAPDDATTEWVVENRNDVMYKNDVFFVDIEVRKQGEKEWRRFVEAEVGDIIEFQTEYINRNKEQMDNVMARAVLPTNMKYMDNSTKLYNSNHPNGLKMKEDTLTTSGVNIGEYNYQGNAYVRFKTQVIDVNLVDGRNQLVTWIGFTQNNEALSYDASVFVEK